ncbi:UROD/MetE-like protein [Dacryopinax primogenitus]|uniref:UROD/MetE-like protein n=1 Tax=Dacryopinax primogenitus (strain DJM 731) TaxID=1858805 RepID=M5G738_DACPD|nr:UROD/MetE-like protein [Dacryopinax primogenitus]EJU01627.1 UROD/MetE-like protein [Dacryopinax primogenitus]
MYSPIPSNIDVALISPFKGEHIGSILRPHALIEARKSHDAGELSSEALKQLEDSCIANVVKFQRDLGFRAVTDGEYRRHMFFNGFYDNLEGITYVPEPKLDIFAAYLPYVDKVRAKGFSQPTYIATGKIRRTKPCYVPWFEYLAKQVPAEEIKHVKMNMASPEWYHFRHMSQHAYTSEAYASDDEYFADIATAFRAELADLYAAGCRNVQIDGPVLTFFCSPGITSKMREMGLDPDSLLDRYIALYNDCLKDRKPDMKIGWHLCRGNFKGGIHYAEGGYDPIAEKVFGKIDVDVFYLEYDTPRTGTFDPLRFVPTNKGVVLGLISSKDPELEDPDYIIARMKEAAAAMGDLEMKRISVSLQCGFASHFEGNNISWEEMEAKLKLVIQVAKKVWGTI